jgi:uncharacterized protein with FMN-binding domain/ferredoxin
MNTKKKIDYLQLIRNLVQLICFLLIPGLFIQSFDGIRALVTGLAQGSMTGVAAALFPTVLLVLATAVFGRFFCGTMCAFGTLQDAAAFLGRKVFHIRWRMPEQADRILKKLKYVILAGLIAGWIFGVDLLANANPWDAFAAIFTLPPAISYAFTSLLAGSILLLLILLSSLFVERFFCRYLCPMGAVFSLASLLRIAKIRKPRRECGSCRLCTRTCKMGIPLYACDKVSSGECISCMKCVQPCPHHNIHPTVGAQDAAPLVASAAAVSVLGLYYVGNLGVNSLLTASAAAPVTSSSETLQQSSAGSDSALESAASAAASASAEQTAQTETAQESSVQSAQTETVQESSVPSAQTETAQSQSEQTTQSAQTETQTAQTQSTQAAASSAQSTASAYKDGTYQGSGTGHKGATTTVSVTIQGGKITDVTTVSTGDDAQFYNRAFTTIVAEIISGQKSQVNAVSGATHSSSGIMSAVADALSQAMA